MYLQILGTLVLLVVEGEIETLLYCSLASTNFLLVEQIVSMFLLISPVLAEHEVLCVLLSISFPLTPCDIWLGFSAFY